MNYIYLSHFYRETCKLGNIVFNEGKFYPRPRFNVQLDKDLKIIMYNYYNFHLEVPIKYTIPSLEHKLMKK